MPTMSNLKATRTRAKMPTKTASRKSRPRLKTRVGINAAGRLLLDHPEGLYRSQIVKKLGLEKRSWQSISKDDVFQKHPDSKPKAKKVKWIVDAPVFRRRYMTHTERADAIRESRKALKPRKPLDGMEDELPETPASKLLKFHEKNAPEGVGLIDFLSGSPPYKTADAGQVVKLTIGSTQLEMTINGSVSFTIRG